MAPDKADKIFWLAYAAAIKQNVGAEVGKTNAFYLASKAQRGPPGGDNISEAYTNEGLHQIGNNLLPADNIFYNPSTSNSYIEQLQTYVHAMPTPTTIIKQADIELPTIATSHGSTLVAIQTHLLLRRSQTGAQTWRQRVLTRNASWSQLRPIMKATRVSV